MIHNITKASRINRIHQHIRRSVGEDRGDKSGVFQLMENGGHFRKTIERALQPDQPVAQRPVADTKSIQAEIKCVGGDLQEINMQPL